MAGTTRCCRVQGGPFRVGCWWVSRDGFPPGVAGLTPLKFPGYPDNGGSCQVGSLRRLCHRILTTKWKIHALNWTRNRVPIPRSKLAHEVARKLERYLNRMAVRLYRDGTSLTVAHERLAGGYSGRICRRSVEDWGRFHENR